MEDIKISNPLLQPKTNYHLWFYGDRWKLTQNWCWSSQNRGTNWFSNLEFLVHKKSWHDWQTLWRVFVSGSQYYVRSPNCGAFQEIIAQFVWVWTKVSFFHFLSVNRENLRKTTGGNFSVKFILVRFFGLENTLQTPCVVRSH